MSKLLFAAGLYSAYRLVVLVEAELDYATLYRRYPHLRHWIAST